MLLFFYFEEVKTRAQRWPLIFHTAAPLYIYIIQAVLKLPRLAQRQREQEAVQWSSFHFIKLLQILQILVFFVLLLYFIAHSYEQHRICAHAPTFNLITLTYWAALKWLNSYNCTLSVLYISCIKYFANTQYFQKMKKKKSIGTMHRFHVYLTHLYFIWEEQYNENLWLSSGELKQRVTLQQQLMTKLFRH